MKKVKPFTGVYLNQIKKKTGSMFMLTVTYEATSTFKKKTESMFMFTVTKRHQHLRRKRNQCSCLHLQFIYKSESAKDISISLSDKFSTNI